MRIVTQLSPLSGYHRSNNPENDTDHALPPGSRGRNKVRVEIDGDQDNCIILSGKEITAYNLKEGEPIPDAVWAQLQADLLHKAIQKSGKLLMNMDYSRQGLTDKLIRSGIPVEAAEAAAGQMEEAGYINDRRFAARYIAYRIHDRSLLRIRQDLLGKKIPEQIIDEEIRLFDMQLIQEQTAQTDERTSQKEEQTAPTEGRTSQKKEQTAPTEGWTAQNEARHETAPGIAGIEQAQIRKLLIKRNFSLEEADYADMQKTAAFLMRKGYSAENIRTVMKSF